MASNATAPPAGPPISPGGFPILNPTTPLAFLPSTIGEQLEAARYLYVASLGAFIWDILCSSGQDFRLLTRYKANLPTIVYFASRIAALAYIVTSTIFQVAPVDSCQGLQVALGWCWAVATPLTSLLFFFRVKAVFAGQRLVVAFFAILWLATLGGSITVPFAIQGGHIAETNRCVNTAVKPFSSVGLIINTCNDTLVFIAISWHITVRSSVKAKFKSFFGGRDLPYISRELLQGGQQYYLITVGGNILTMAFILSPSIPPILRAMFTIPNMALENSMACRVFRDIKLGRTAPSRTLNTSDNTGVAASGPGYAMRTFGGSDIPAGRVEVRKTVEKMDDLDTVHTVVMPDDMGRAGKFVRTDDTYV